MTKTIQKNLLVVGGLFFLAQTAIISAVQASALTDANPTYFQAATSVDPVIFGHKSLFGDAIANIAEIFAQTARLDKVVEKTESNIINKVEDNAEATSEDIRAYVLAEIKKAGLNTREAESLIFCESRWDDKAKGVNRNGSYDLGLWQINSIHKDISSSDKLDYKASTKWAIAKRLSDGSWSAWSCSRKIARTKVPVELALNAN